MIDLVKAEGGKVTSLTSYGAGLPAFEHNNNPFGYKFSWSPKGVLLAAQAPAAYLKNGNIIAITPALEAIADESSNFLPNNEVQGTMTITGDVTAPTVILTYNPDRTVEYTDFITITATFSESLEEISSCPSIAIDTEGDGSLSSTNMSMVSQTVWTYVWEVPGGIDENGVATIDINATDLAGNDSQVAANNIRNDIGVDVFEQQLGIPSAHIEPFIRFCQKKDIINLYVDGKILQVIDILLEEKDNYIRERLNE